MAMFGGSKEGYYKNELYEMMKNLYSEAKEEQMSFGRFMSLVLEATQTFCEYNHGGDDENE